MPHWLQRLSSSRLIVTKSLGSLISVNLRPTFQTGPTRIAAFDQAVESRASGSRRSLAHGAASAAAGNAFISVEGFLQANAKATTRRRGEVSTMAEKSAFTRLKRTDDGRKQPGGEHPVRSVEQRPSPIEFDVSPLRPQSAVDWAFDIKAPHPSASVPSNDEHDELQSESCSLPDLAVLDPCSTSGDRDSSLPGENATLRLRTRDIPRKDILGHSGSESETCDFDELASQTPAKQTRNKRKSRKVQSKSLGTRLFEACVATHGNPMDSLVVPPQTGQTPTGHDEIEAGRKPLPFIPVQEPCATPASGDLLENKKHGLVDPHCTEPFRTAYFGPPMKLHGKARSQEVTSEVGQSSIVYKALSNWQPKLGDISFQEAPSQKQVRSRRKRGLQKEGQARPEIAYAPLEFVPLSEALLTRENRKSHRVPQENRIV